MAAMRVAVGQEEGDHPLCLELKSQVVRLEIQVAENRLQIERLTKALSVVCASMGAAATAEMTFLK